MKLDHSEKGTVQINVSECIEKTSKEFGFDLGDFSPTSPAADHPFKVRDNAPELDNNEKQTFHTVTAKGLFVHKRARPNAQVAITF